VWSSLEVWNAVGHWGDWRCGVWSGVDVRSGVHSGGRRGGGGVEWCGGVEWGGSRGGGGVWSGVEVWSGVGPGGGGVECGVVWSGVGPWGGGVWSGVEVWSGAHRAVGRPVAGCAAFCGHSIHRCGVAVEKRITQGWSGELGTQSETPWEPISDWMLH
jgi:hypothetical protein